MNADQDMCFCADRCMERDRSAPFRFDARVPTKTVRDIRADILAWRVCVSCGGSPLNERGSTCLFAWPEMSNTSRSLEPVCQHCQTVLRLEEVLARLRILDMERNVDWRLGSGD